MTNPVLTPLGKGAASQAYARRGYEPSAVPAEANWEQREEQARQNRCADLVATRPERVEKILRGCGIPTRFRQARLGDLNQSLLAACSTQVRAREGLGLIGKSGCGKTHAAAAYFRHRVEERYDFIAAGQGLLVGPWGIFTNWTSELAELRRLMVEGGMAERIDNLIEAPILFLDDLGAEKAVADMATSWPRERLYEIVDGRYAENRPIVWTTQLSLKELDERYNERIVSRLEELGAPIRMAGANRRRE